MDFFGRKKRFMAGREIYADEMRKLSLLLLDALDSNKKYHRNFEALFQELIRECESCLRKLKHELAEEAGVKLPPHFVEAEKPLRLLSDVSLAEELRRPMTMLKVYSGLNPPPEAEESGQVIREIYGEFEMVLKRHDSLYDTPNLKQIKGDTDE